jgi:hypothetical protein
MNREDVMKGAQLLRVFTGQPVDDVAALAAELEAEKERAAEACARLDWLKLERKTADSFEAARALDEEVAKAQWTIERADAVLPHLEGRLKAARAEHQAAALARHQAILRKRYPKFRAALQEAVEQQAAVIQEREAAVAELGEHLVQTHVPNLVFAGFLFRDLLAIWTAENDRIFSERVAKPAIVAPRPAPAPVPAKPAEPAAFGFGWTRRQPGDEPVAAPEPPPRPKRVPRRDANPADGSERQVVLLRTGLELPDGTQGVAGDVVTVPADRAAELLRSGAADFIGETK